MTVEDYLELLQELKMLLNKYIPIPDKGKVTTINCLSHDKPESKKAKIYYKL